ncbi:hypothetical protein BZM26_23700 [Paraburkholderia strydomiana]|nr:hypothetical protein BZM26_23700 [Paraburkholderia strydomiana]
MVFASLVRVLLKGRPRVIDDSPTAHSWHVFDLALRDSSPPSRTGLRRKPALRRLTAACLPHGKSATSADAV